MRRTVWVIQERTDNQWHTIRPTTDEAPLTASRAVRTWEQLALEEKRDVRILLNGRPVRMNGGDTADDQLDLDGVEE